MTDDPLRALVDLPGVRGAVDAARVACEELRWHEAFRRRWREVRVESGLRAASASAALDGARVPLDRLRAMAVGLEPGADTDGGPVPRDRSAEVAIGALRAQAAVEALMPDLGARFAPALPPFGQLLAAVHTAAAGGWLEAADVGRLRVDAQPQDLRGLGPAPAGADVAARVDLLGQVVRQSRAPALVVAGVVHGELLALRPFLAGNGVVARAVFRLLLTSGRLDPTGAVISDSAWVAAPNPYLGAAARFASGDPDGVAAWLRACAGAVGAGATAGVAVADAVLAGRLG